MKKNLLATLLLLLTFFCGFSQEQPPAVEWAEPYRGGTRGGSISPFKGPGHLFALIKYQNSNSGSANISKFNADGIVKDQYISAEGGSSNAPVMTQCASQDGGVLVFLLMDRVLRKYDDNLNLSWQKNVSYQVQNATPTQSNGFYLLTNRFVSNTTVTEIKRIKSDGSEEWTIELTDIINISDLKTSADDGLIVAYSNGVRKYNANGSLAWSNTGIFGSYQIMPSADASFYVLARNNTTNISYVVLVNSSNGNATWTKSLTGETISDFERTSDNGCVFSTNTGLYKYNSSGVLQWKNVDYTSGKIAVSGDDKIFVVRDNAIFKLNYNNETLWTKNFNRNHYIIQDIHEASDFGLYVNAVKNATTFNTSPNFLVFKLAAPASPCKMSFDITGNSATFCQNGSIDLGASFGKVSFKHMALLTDISIQWYRGNFALTSATDSAYTTSINGNYRLEVTQGNCEALSRSVTLKIVNETSPFVTTDKRIICQGTQTSLRALGCEGTVVWSTGDTGDTLWVAPTATTSYSAVCQQTINNETCQSAPSLKFTITVVSTSNLQITAITGSKEFCEQDSTVLEPVITGGIAPFSYIWASADNTFSYEPKLVVTQENKYILRVFDNAGCSASTDLFEIRKNAKPLAPTILSPSGTQICTGATVSLTTAAKENSYLWFKNNTGIAEATKEAYTPTSAGIYKLKVTNTKGCSAMSANTITITEVVIPQPSIKQSNDSLVSSAASGNKWYFNGGELSQTSPKIQFTQLGSYQVKVFDKGCESPISAVFQPVLLANEEHTPYIQMYPNPTADKVYLKSARLFTYKLIDAAGRLVGKSTVKQDTHTIDFTGFSTGTYLIVLEQENGNAVVKKVNVSR
ncbi:T9SS type A sorting domain-containing protein [Emticicia fluvialis]|uniref:T9SS type A sorting domain-containing protein n=1 Tax=Emticicia fluvialis TaxID=2974474 RepID=UPI002164F5F0|nr:T9SS type A sorting domain-containing protein [Emticicia fluvialis]